VSRAWRARVSGSMSGSDLPEAARRKASAAPAALGKSAPTVGDSKSEAARSRVATAFFARSSLAKARIAEEADRSAALSTAARQPVGADVLSSGAVTVLISVGVRWLTTGAVVDDATLRTLELAQAQSEALVANVARYRNARLTLSTPPPSSF
jgi:hypothetical protein